MASNNILRAGLAAMTMATMVSTSIANGMDRETDDLGVLICQPPTSHRSQHDDARLQNSGWLARMDYDGCSFSYQVFTELIPERPDPDRVYFFALRCGDDGQSWNLQILGSQGFPRGPQVKFTLRLPDSEWNAEGTRRGATVQVAMDPDELAKFMDRAVAFPELEVKLGQGPDAFRGSVRSRGLSAAFHVFEQMCPRVPAFPTRPSRDVPRPRALAMLRWSTVIERDESGQKQEIGGRGGIGPKTAKLTTCPLPTAKNIVAVARGKSRVPRTIAKS